jgi:hypothetical protein
MPIHSMPATQPPTEIRIPLTPAMVLSEEAQGDSSLLVDEQSISGDPTTAGKGGKPKNPYFTGWGNTWRFPLHLVINLGQERDVSRLFFYIETGGGEIKFSYGKPFAWSAETTIERAGYQSWKEVKINAKTRFVRLTLTAPTSIPEVIIYATDKAKTLAAPPKITGTHPIIPFEQFMGTNAFIDDPIDTISAVGGFQREYHLWSWDTEKPDGKQDSRTNLRFQPSGAAGGNLWFFDDYYAKLKAKGVTVAPVLQDSLEEVRGGGGKGAFKPILPGADSTNPASYLAHAQHMYQFAARYGSTKVPDTMLTLATNQPRRSGLGTLKYLENWNEPDRSWDGREGWFAPYELAAMSSADFDGHGGTLGKNVGVKNADPMMQFSIGGLAGISLEYLRAMKFWSDYNRAGKPFPANVLNMHHYCTDVGEQGGGFGKTGISPESDKLREKMTKITQWRDANLPGCEVWLTEFGWDTDPRSPFHCPATGSLSAEDVQAAWLVREFLLLSASGVDRAAQFMLRDVKTGGGGAFETCGLVTEKGQWKPKPSYYAATTLKAALAGTRFERDIPTGKPDVQAMLFSGNNRNVTAVWSGTDTDKTIMGVNIPAPMGAKTATLIRYKTGSVTGVTEALPLKNGIVTLTISEKPVFIAWK